MTQEIVILKIILITRNRFMMLHEQGIIDKCKKAKKLERLTRQLKFRQNQEICIYTRKQEYQIVLYPEKELLKGLVQSSNTKCRGNATWCSVYSQFLYILQSYVYLYTQFQKKTRPGKLLNFTKIHRQNITKTFTFS